MTEPVPLPNGFSIVLDSQTRRLAPDTLFGGTPARVMRLTATGQKALAELENGPIRTAASGVLARRLTDAGLAHPRPPLSVGLDVTVLIPVRDRPRELDRCLAALRHDYPVVVVDDASLDPEAIAKVAADHGATLIARTVNGGPGVARNTGLASISTEYVALLDSDCVPEPGWIEALASHLGDPLVAIAAPRITADSDSKSFAGRYASARAVLDLGADEALVRPLTGVAFIPSAALVARTAALHAVAVSGDVFDPAMRTGEDVDLVWRLHKAGWRIRYDAAATVTHHEPDRWRVLMSRRFRYGASAGPLARRHPDAMPPLVLNAWPGTAVAGAIVASPPIAALGYLGSIVQTRRALGRAKVSPQRAVPMASSGVLQTWLSCGRFATQLLSPLLLAGLLLRRTRLGALSLLLGPPVLNWLRGGRQLDPARFAVAHIADDVAYGAGVWASALAEHTAVPLTPISTSRARSNMQSNEKKERNG